MFYYLWWVLGYEMDEEDEIKKKIDEEKFVIEIKKDKDIYLRKNFNKELAYKDVVEELRRYLKSKDNLYT